MDCDRVRQLLLDLGLTEAARRRIVDALAHAEACADCRGAVRDFDRLVAALQAGRPADDADGPGADGAASTEAPAGTDENRGGAAGESAQSGTTPAGGWESFEQRMEAAVATGRRPPLRLAVTG